MNRSTYHNRKRGYDYYMGRQAAREELAYRSAGYYLVVILGIPTALAMGYLGIQIWAWTITSRWYPSYALPCVAIILGYLVLSVIVSKLSRPVEEY